MVPLRCGRFLLLGALLAAAQGTPLAAATSVDNTWPQWGRTQTHSGYIPTVQGQNLNKILLSYNYDTAVSDEIAQADGDLLVHYATPLTEGASVYMMLKKGPFDPSKYATQTWGLVRFDQVGSTFTKIWSMWLDYKAPGSENDFWEPVFHPALANGFLYAPSGWGTLYKINKTSGVPVARIKPPAAIHTNTSYVSSPVTVDSNGNLFYTVVQLKPGVAGFFDDDVAGSWLIRVTPDGAVSTVSFSTLVPNAPTACLGTFSAASLPWPPSTTAVPASFPCGAVRAGVNAAPALNRIYKTVYVVARTHFNSRYGWLVAVNASTLQPIWNSSLRERFNDGCGTPTLPPNGRPGGCRTGAKYGVDPATNLKGGGRVLDDSSSSPIVAPDGTIYYGAYNRYNYAQGHLMRFSNKGDFLSYFGFGWDTTPGIWEHDGTHSLITKENHYGGLGAYCNDDGTYCPTDRGAGEIYYITQLSADLKSVEWRYTSTQTDTCVRNATGQVTCTPNTNPYGFEWCVNAPAIDSRGVVYVNSEDGWLYAIDQGGTLRQRIFQQTTLGAAYTPASIGPTGLIFSQNSGYLIVVGA